MKRWLTGLALVSSFSVAQAAELKVNDPAPNFTLKTHEGKDFELKSRAGQWTVLYFYPKDDTPGCTKQACAFRDNIKKIRAQSAEVYGISADTVEKHASFHKSQRLNFALLADPEAKIIEQYGAKMPAANMSNRWTFIVNPELKIAAIDKDVDPVVDSEKIADQIAALKKK
ncbi:MAG: peroxiredoxin [Pseudobdellovibrionaceae bacterium]|uniref:peroxiredoxin n=1 Tax=Oligoflexus sp. TaxID=1971216 RepID=UPI0027BB49DD|nr:peroxiredoxin [Oligoflexus sp.]MDQ3234847.1 peroxiredoxin [Pseudobdellovibrionaceae bacterium]HYX36657.1 peroxiredoxin [Oligoflexus sp.]